MIKRFIIAAASVLLAIAAYAEDMNVTVSPDGLKQAFTRGNDL